MRAAFPQQYEANCVAHDAGATAMRCYVPFGVLQDRHGVTTCSMGRRNPVCS